MGKSAWPVDSWAICRIIAGCLGILSNIVQIVLISRSRDKRTVFAMTLLSLSVADLLTSILLSVTACLNFPLNLLNIANHDWFSIIRTFGVFFSIATSGLHILFIGIQRLCVVMFPLRFKRIFTKFRSRVALVAIWVICAGPSPLVDVLPRSMNLYAGYFLIVECIVLVFLYGLLCYKMQRNKRRPMLTSTNRKSNARIFLHSLAVLSAFLICNLPLALVFAFYFRGFEALEYKIGTFLMGLNPLLDSMVYFLSSFCTKNKRPTSKRRPSSTDHRMREVSSGTQNQQVCPYENTAL